MNYSKQKTLVLKEKQSNQLASLFKSSSKLANNLLERQNKFKNKETYGNLSIYNTSSSLKDSNNKSIINDLISETKEKDNIKLAFNNKELNYKASFDNKDRNNTLFIKNPDNLQIQKQANSHKPELIVRNLKHDYLNVESNENSYNIQRIKRLNQRAFHFDKLEEYEYWRELSLKELKNKYNLQINQCEDNIKSTRMNFLIEYELSKEILEEMELKDIKEIEDRLNKEISKRQLEIKDSKKITDNYIKEANLTFGKYHTNLKEKLIDNGYLLSEEIEVMIDKKITEINEIITNSNSEIEEKYEKISNFDEKVQKELILNLRIFIKKWKNVKLNKFLLLLKSKLNGKDVVENEILSNIIKDLNKDLVFFYNERMKIVMNVYNFKSDCISMNEIELSLKSIDDIYIKAQERYDFHTNNLNKYRNYISKISNDYIKEFNDNVNTLSFTFGEENSDNTLLKEEIKIDFQREIKKIEKDYVLPPFNETSFYIEKKKKLNKKEEAELNEKEKKYEEERKEKLIQKENLISELTRIQNESNVYIECKEYIRFYGFSNLDSILKAEIEPIIDEQNKERIKYCSEIVTYVDEFDEFNNSISMKIINFIGKLAKSNDLHKANFKKEETNYLIDIAKEEDNDEEENHIKEEKLKEILIKMKESVHKESLNECLIESLLLLDSLDNSYRDFFNKVQCVLNTHEMRIKNSFSLYESTILSIFGILNEEKLEEIKQRRLFESEVKSRVIQFEKEEQERKEMESSQSKIKKPQPQKNIKGKKETNLNIVELKPIEHYISNMQNKYYIDSSIDFIIQIILKNIYFNRDDEYLTVIPKDLLDNYIQIQIDIKNIQSQAKKPQQKGKNESQQGFFPKEFDIKSIYNPYEEIKERSFISPLLFNKEKALFDENKFTKDYLISIISKYMTIILDNIIKEYNKTLEELKKSDEIKKENYLNMLDFRLKSINPRKGKIQVDEYEKRLSQIENHKEKYNKFNKIILDKNNKDLIENNKIWETKINPLYTENISLYERLMKVIEEENSIKGIEDILNKYKSEYYNFISILDEEETGNLNKFSNLNPNNLIHLCNNFISSMIPFNKKEGTYSYKEIEYYSSLINEISTNVIQTQMIEMKNSNQQKIQNMKETCQVNLNKIEKKYSSIKDIIMAKNSIGNVFGQPKRLLNEISINLKMKVNQGIEGINDIFESLREIIDLYEENMKTRKLDYLSKNDIPIKLRKNLMMINNCIFTIGKYLDAFKTGFSYSLIRVTLNESQEGYELLNKDDILNDTKLQDEELKKLGFLYSSIQVGDKEKNKKDDKVFTFMNELNGIDDKVKLECAKIYTGEYSKLISQNEKMPLALHQYLNKTKEELLNFRINNIRILKGISKNLFNLSIDIGKCLFEYIYSYSLYNISEKFQLSSKKYSDTKTKSQKIKQNINSKMGPYLANPIYKSELEEYKSTQENRNIELIKTINDIQLDLIIDIEKENDYFYKRTVNNFEAFVILFDNYIYEEEYMQIGDLDEEQRKDYNFLLKLKEYNKEINLNSKRSIKKVVLGLDKSLLIYNYPSKYPNLLKEVCNEVEEKIKALKEYFIKKIVSRSMNINQLENNKKMILYRNTYFNDYAKIAEAKINEIIEFYNRENMEECEYYKNWQKEIKN